MSLPIATFNTKSFGHCHGPMDTFPPFNLLINNFVKINGIPILTQGSFYIVHACPNDFRMFPRIVGGSSNVRINGRPIARVNDAIDCGDLVGQDQIFCKST